MRRTCNNLQTKGCLVVQLAERLTVKVRRWMQGSNPSKTAKIRSLKILPWWWNGEVSLPVYKEIYKCNLPNSVNAKSV